MGKSSNSQVALVECLFTASKSHPCLVYCGNRLSRNLCVPGCILPIASCRPRAPRCSPVRGCCAVFWAIRRERSVICAMPCHRHKEMYCRCRACWLSVLECVGIAEPGVCAADLPLSVGKSVPIKQVYCSVAGSPFEPGHLELATAQ